MTKYMNLWSNSIEFNRVWIDFTGKFINIYTLLSISDLLDMSRSSIFRMGKIGGGGGG
jgi:hypothetical protein